MAKKKKHGKASPKMNVSEAMGKNTKPSVISAPVVNSANANPQPKALPSPAPQLALPKPNAVKTVEKKAASKKESKPAAKANQSSKAPAKPAEAKNKAQVSKPAVNKASSKKTAAAPKLAKNLADWLNNGTCQNSLWPFELYLEGSDFHKDFNMHIEDSAKIANNNMTTAAHIMENAFSFMMKVHEKNVETFDGLLKCEVGTCHDFIALKNIDDFSALTQKCLSKQNALILDNLSQVNVCMHDLYMKNSEELSKCCHKNSKAMYHKE